MTGTGSLSEDDVSVKLITPAPHLICRGTEGGKLPTFKLTSTWRLCRGELDQLIASRIGMATVKDDEGAE